MSRLKSSRDSGFSRKIGTIPPRSGRLDTAENALKLLILLSARYFVPFYIFYDPIRKTFWLLGGGGGAPRAPPLPTGLIINQKCRCYDNEKCCIVTNLIARS